MLVTFLCSFFSFILQRPTRPARKIFRISVLIMLAVGSAETELQKIFLVSYEGLPRIRGEIAVLKRLS